jgi:hypothetical protein
VFLRPAPVRETQLINRPNLKLTLAPKFLESATGVDSGPLDRRNSQDLGGEFRPARVRQKVAPLYT